MKTELRYVDPDMRTKILPKLLLKMSAQVESDLDYFLTDNLFPTVIRQLLDHIADHIEN